MTTAQMFICRQCRSILKTTGQSRHTFLAITGAEVKGWDTDREIFLGPYRTYANPVVVEEGKCKNSIAVGDNGCGTLQVDIELEAGESKELVVLMGIGARVLRVSRL